MCRQEQPSARSNQAWVGRHQQACNCEQTQSESRQVPMRVGKWEGLNMGILRVGFSHTVPVPTNTIPVPGIYQHDVVAGSRGSEGLEVVCPCLVVSHR